MIKHIFLNRRKIPCPVPLKRLNDAVSWVEAHLLRSDHTITRIKLDGEEIDFQSGMPNLPLKANTKLEMQIDSPLDISVQTLDALRNLCVVLERSLKPLAVKLWQMPKQEESPEIEMILSDLLLIEELFDHIQPLLKKQIDLSSASTYCDHIQKAHAAIDLAIQHHDWQACARILLKNLEPGLKQLNLESEMLQKMIFELQADRRDFLQGQTPPQQKYGNSSP